MNSARCLTCHPSEHSHVFTGMTLLCHAAAIQTTQKKRLKKLKTQVEQNAQKVIKEEIDKRWGGRAEKGEVEDREIETWLKC